MKCPEQFKIVQHNIRRPLVDNEDRIMRRISFARRNAKVL